MPRIRIDTRIRAPIERCFDLSRSIDFHLKSMSKSNEKVIAGVQTGLIAMGQEVKWRAHHFGVWLTLTSKIVSYHRPYHFRDSMSQGPFKSFDHDHHFRQENEFTMMGDIVDFQTPLGIVGAVLDGILLSRYMHKLLTRRADEIKIVAETDSWKQFLDQSFGTEPGEF